MRPGFHMRSLTCSCTALAELSHAVRLVLVVVNINQQERGAW